MNAALFQLHHTGIKTQQLGAGQDNRKPFQLHHTGIKTTENLFQDNRLDDFNCTIQELKRSVVSTSFFSNIISIAPYRN